MARKHPSTVLGKLNEALDSLQRAQCQLDAGMCELRITTYNSMVLSHLCSIAIKTIGLAKSDLSMAGVHGP